jgi:hypothetical protein
MERHDSLDPDSCFCAWISTGEELWLWTRRHTFKERNSVCSLRSLGKGNRPGTVSRRRATE